MAVRDIKTKEVLQGTIKTVDRTAMAGQRMKDAYIQTKHKAEHSVYSSESNTEEYAAEQMTDAVSTVAHETVHQMDVQGQKIIQGARQKFGQRQAQKAQQPHRVSPDGAVPLKQEAVRNQQSTSAKAVLNSKRTTPWATSSVSNQRKVPGSIHSSMEKTIKTVEKTDDTIKQTARAAGRTTIKAPGRTIKTASSTVKSVEQVGSTSVKTAQATFKAAQKTAIESAKTAQRIRAAAKAAKAIIAAAQELITAIAAGGWIAILVIAVILMVGLITGSVFGIFFSSQDTGNGLLMKDVVQEINTEYQSTLDELQENIDHDKVEMSGSRAVWPEVLSVYAVMVASDPNNPMEVTTMDDNKKAILENIFWQMNVITYEEETREEMDLKETVDSEGNIIEEWTAVEKDYLLITVAHKSAEEMAGILGFDAKRKDLLVQLLSEEYDSLWASVLYGIDSGDGMIVEVAMSQVGNIGGQPYWSWYGFESRVEWCACFVSWCANECGYIDAGIIPKFAGCINGVQWFKDRGQWTDNSAEPIPGMIIFFDWEDESDGGGLDGQPDHVGIVEKVENGRVYTIEGNTSDSCRERSYPVGYYEILGYGIPAY